MLKNFPTFLEKMFSYTCLEKVICWNVKFLYASLEKSILLKTKEICVLSEKLISLLEKVFTFS